MSLNKFGNSEVELQRVGGANACIRRQFTIFCAEPITVRLLRTLRLVTSDDIMTSLLNKLSISIKIHAVKPLYSVSILLTESVGSRRELVPNCVHSSQLHTADATQLRVLFLTTLKHTGRVFSPWLSEDKRRHHWCSLVEYWWRFSRRRTRPYTRHCQRYTQRTNVNNKTTLCYHQHPQ